MFFVGLLFNAFGVAFVTKAALGTSPIAAIPYSLSMIIPKLTLGNWTIIAFGAYLEVVADVVMLPGDAFVRIIAKVAGKEYGGVRVISDVSMAAVAAVLCLVFLRRLSGGVKERSLRRLSPGIS